MLLIKVCGSIEACYYHAYNNRTLFSFPRFSNYTKEVMKSSQADGRLRKHVGEMETGLQCLQMTKMNASLHLTHKNK